MARSLSPNVLVEIDKRLKRVEILAELEYQTITFRAWSGVGDKTFFGNVYQGVGDLGNMSDITESKDLKGANVEFHLNEAEPALVRLVMNEARFGRSARAWLALLDEFDQVIDGDSGLISIYDGDMEVPVVEKASSGSEPSIAQRAVSDLEAIRSTRMRRYTPADQQIDFPGDKGLDFITTLRDTAFTLKTQG